MATKVKAAGEPARRGTKTGQEAVNDDDAGLTEQDRRKKRYDRAAKRVLSSAPILALIVKYNVPEAADMSIKEIVRRIRHPAARRDGASKPSSLLEKTESGDIICDVLFTFKVKEGVFVRINVEAQNKANPGYSLVTRGILYAAQLLAEQTELGWVNGASYDGLRKVYTIWLVSNAALELQGRIRRFELAGSEFLQDGSEKVLPKLAEADKICIVMAYLPKEAHLGEVRQHWLRAFSVLLNPESTRTACEQVLSECGVPVGSMLKKEILKMCSLSDGIVESVTKSMNEKFNKERVRIENETKRKMVLSMLKNGMPMDSIKKIAELPEKVIRTWMTESAGMRTSF